MCRSKLKQIEKALKRVAIAITEDITSESATGKSNKVLFKKNPKFPKRELTNITADRAPRKSEEVAPQRKLPPLEIMMAYIEPGAYLKKLQNLHMREAKPTTAENSSGRYEEVAPKSKHPSLISLWHMYNQAPNSKRLTRGKPIV